MGWINIPVGVVVDPYGVAECERYTFCNSDRCAHVSHPQYGVIVRKLPKKYRLIANYYDGPLCFVELRVVKKDVD